MLGREKLQEITGIDIHISSSMKSAIDLWNAMWKGQADWNTKNPTCGILDCIAGMISTPIGEEISVSSKNERLGHIIGQLNENSFKIVQQMAILGGVVLRPIYANSKVQYELLPLGNYLPLAYDFDGTLTSAILLKAIIEGKKQFLLVEHNSFRNHSHTVESKLYEVKSGMFKPVPLTYCKQTEAITERFVWQNVKHPFIVEFRNRTINKIDGSSVPVSILSGLEHLIKQADEQWGRMNWEQEGGELRVFADQELFRPIQNARNTADRVKLDPDLDKLFLKLNNGEDSDKITVFSPQLRTAEQDLFLQQIFRRIEFASGVGKGSLSDIEDVKMTATQYSGGKKAFYSTIDSMENELADKYKQAAYIFAYMLSAYENIPFEDEITVEYNDIARQDPQIMKQTDMQEVNNGIMQIWEYRMKHYGEDEATAKANAQTPLPDEKAVI